MGRGKTSFFPIPKTKFAGSKTSISKTKILKDTKMEKLGDSKIVWDYTAPNKYRVWCEKSVHQIAHDRKGKSYITYMWHVKDSHFHSSFMDEETARLQFAALCSTWEERTPYHARHTR